MKKIIAALIISLAITPAYAGMYVSGHGGIEKTGFSKMEGKSYKTKHAIVKSIKIGYDFDRVRIEGDIFESDSKIFGDVYYPYNLEIAGFGVSGMLKIIQYKDISFFAGAGISRISVGTSYNQKFPKVRNYAGSCIRSGIIAVIEYDITKKLSAELTAKVNPEFSVDDLDFDKSKSILIGLKYNF